MKQIDPKALEVLAQVLELGAGVAVAVAAPGSDVAAGAQIADKLLVLVQKGISAYESQTGKPMDPALLRPFVPLTD